MDLKGKTILVTGGAGFIGSHLVDGLRLAAHHVRIVDDFSTGQHANLAQHSGQQVEILQGDICDETTIAEAMRGVQVVFHLACRGVRHSIGHPEENHQVNAFGTLSLLRMAKRYGVERFVHVSSSEVYGTTRYAPMDEEHPCFPETVYGAAKLAGEAYARAYFRTYALPTVIVRPFNNFGPRSHFEGDSGEVIPRFCVWALNNKPPIIFGDGSQTRDFIYVEETANWLVRTAQCDDLVGQTINLGSGAETSIRELAAIVYEEAGVPAIAPEYRKPRPGDVRRLVADASLARNTLDFAVRVGLREGIRRLLDHFRSQRQAPQDLLGAVEDTNWTLVSAR
jgi:UDP-glucose 4-epimerase